jgi:hypothetical protein
VVHEHPDRQIPVRDRVVVCTGGSIIRVVAFGTVRDGADAVFLDDGVVKSFAGGVLGVPCIFGVISDIIS